MLFAVPLIVGLRMDQWPALLGLPLALVLARCAWRGEASALQALVTPRLVWALALLQGLSLAALIGVEYASVSYNVYDTGVFAHLAMNLSAGRGWFSELQQQHAFLDHFTPALALFAPLFWVCPTALWLPIVRLAAYLACALLLWSLSEHYLRGPALRRLVVAMWLTSYPMLHVMTFEFQPSNLAPVAVFAAALAVKRSKWTWCIALGVLTLGLKEQMGLAWVAFGLWLALCEGRAGLGALVATLGLAAGLLVNYAVVPAIAGATSSQLTKLDPLALVDRKVLFLGRIVLSLGLFPLAFPRSLPVLVAASAITLVSGVPAMATLRFHYQDLPTAFGFLALLSSLRHLEARQSWVLGLGERARTAALVASVIAVVFSNMDFPSRALVARWPTRGDLETVAEARALAPRLEPDRALYALDSLGIYFIEAPRLRSIHAPQAVLEERGPHVVVLADGVNHWPLREQYETLKRELETRADEGRYLRVPGLRRLSVYVSRESAPATGD